MTDYKELVKRRTLLENPQEVIRFETWWNKNLATVVNGSSPYSVYLLVCIGGQNVNTFKIGENVYSYYDAVEKARALRTNLNGENPILHVHPQATTYVHFDRILIHSNYKVDNTLPVEMRIETYKHCTCYPGCPCYHCDCEETEIKYLCPNLDNHLKPLDEVWVKKSTLGNSYYHIGVYIGSGDFFHYSGKDKKQYKARMKISSWDEFVKGCIDKQDIWWYRSVIPFKHYETIAQQIDWANDNSYWEGKYCLANNNCEHRVSSFVYGVDFSRQVMERPSASIDNCRKWHGECNGECRSGIANKNKGSTINLNNEIARTESQLSKSSGYLYNKIKNEYEAKTVEPPKNCRIM